MRSVPLSESELARLPPSCAALARPPLPPLARLPPRSYVPPEEGEGVQLERLQRTEAWKKADRLESWREALPVAAEEAAEWAAQEDATEEFREAAERRMALAWKKPTVLLARVVELRFLPGTRVACCRERALDPNCWWDMAGRPGAKGPPCTFDDGEVTQILPANDEAEGAPYEVRLHDGTLFYPKADSDRYIRRKTRPAIFSRFDAAQSDAGAFLAASARPPAAGAAEPSPVATRARSDAAKRARFFAEADRMRRNLDAMNLYEMREEERREEEAEKSRVARRAADAGGRAVLTAEEAEALLSDEGQALLRDAADAFGVTLGEGLEPYHLLRGFVVRRHAAVLRARETIYSPARIRDVYPVAAASGQVHWQLELTTYVFRRGRNTWEEREEPPSPLSYLSNGEMPRDELFILTHYCRPSADAIELGRALSCGEGSARLDRLVATARSGVAAIDRWAELLHEAGVCDDESETGGKDKIVVVGEYSYHHILFSRLHGARAALRDFFDEITHPEVEEGDAAVWQSWLVQPFAKWPPGRRAVAEAWVRWLVGPEQRRAGFQALLEFVEHESGLPHDEHISRDYAGRFSLAGAACEALIGAAGELEADGLMEKLADPEREACAVCGRTPRSCVEWTQMFPCHHWCCTPCISKWRRVAEGEGAAEGGAMDVQEREDIAVHEAHAEHAEGLFGDVARIGACPECRARVVSRSFVNVREEEPFVADPRF